MYSELQKIIINYKKIINGLDIISGNTDVIMKIVENVNIIEKFLEQIGIDPTTITDENFSFVLSTAFSKIDFPPAMIDELKNKLSPITLDDINSLDKVNAGFIYALYSLGLLIKE